MNSAAMTLIGSNCTGMSVAVAEFNNGRPIVNNLGHGPVGKLPNMSYRCTQHVMQPLHSLRCKNFSIDLLLGQFLDGKPHKMHH